MPLMQDQIWEPVLVHRSLLGEGPVWDAKTKTICWVDILNGDVHEYNPVLHFHHTLHLNEMVGSVALCTDGNFVAALKSGLAFVDRNSGDITRFCHPESHLPQNRFNDGKCDPAGRFWVGSMAISEATAAGNLYMIDRDCSHSLKIEGVTISNGMAWSPDHRTFYYIDTPSPGVMAYDFELATGNISNRRIAFEVPVTEGIPDGMTIDTEGMLWIAHWDGWQVTRWNPKTGKQLLGIRLPVARVTSCVFGGEDLRDLYISSASVGLTEQQREKQPLAGSLFVIKDCGFRGMDAFAFNHQREGL